MASSGRLVRYEFALKKRKEELSVESVESYKFYPFPYPFVTLHQPTRFWHALVYTEKYLWSKSNNKKKCYAFDK